MRPCAFAPPCVPDEVAASAGLARRCAGRWCRRGGAVVDRASARAGQPYRGTVRRTRRHAAHHRAAVGGCRGADLAAASVRMVPLVAPGAQHPRRQLRADRRDHTAPVARQDGARRRDAGLRAAARRLDLRAVARGAGQGRGAAAHHGGDERRGSDDGARPPGRGTGRALLSRHLRLQPRRERSGRARASPPRDAKTPRGRLGAAPRRYAAAQCGRGADPRLHRREGNPAWKPTAPRWRPCSSTACASACRCRPTRR